MLRLCVLFVFLASSFAGKVCNVFGDPHVVTFDGSKFKFNGDCTYVLSMDCVEMSWIIYGGFSQCGRGSCLNDITVFNTVQGARDAVLIGRGWVINNQGTKLPFRKGEDFSVGGIAVRFDGLYLTIKLEGAGVTLVYDGFTGLQISIDENVPEGKICGLCGNNDGDPDNEISQLRDIGNDVEGARLFGTEELIFRWKVDRGDYCSKPTVLDFNRQLPCGNDYRKNEKARTACQELVDNQELFKCHGTLNLKTFYEACLTDFCNVELLVEEYPVACATASAYAKHCQMIGARVVDEVWRREMSCPDEETIRNGIMRIGVEQPENSPLLE